MRRPAVRDATRTARAFAPGHVTGFFDPSLEARDPRGRGSTGGGLVLGAGATAEATWTPEGPSRVTVRSPAARRLPISEEVARRLAAPCGGRVEVRIVHELPIGQGFGASASGALATGLAVARATGQPTSRAVEVAHLAELFGGGGLGGVAAILGGGVELRVRPGIPPFGRILHRLVRGSVFVGIVGRPIASPDVLGDPRTLERIRSAAADISRGTHAPTLAGLMDDAERFTDRLALGGARLNAEIQRLRGPGVRVAQAMFGRSFFAVASTPAARRSFLRTLERRGLRALELPLARRGAFAEQSLLSRGRVGANP